MKKILMVTHWYYPSNIPRAFRAKELYDQLKLDGYIVDIIIGDYKMKILHDETYDLSKFETIDNKHSSNIYNNKFIQKIKSIIEYFIGERYLFSRFKFIYKNIDLDNYDVVISLGIPFYIHLLVATKLKRASNIISIADWSDPFYNKKNNNYAFYFHYLQKYICNRFNYTVIPTHKAWNYFSEYTEEEKIKEIPQGFNFDKIEVQEYKKNEVVTFGYAGIFYKDIRNPEMFFEFLCSLDFNFKFIIYTVKHGSVYEDILVKYQKILGEKLIIIDRIDRIECIKRLSIMDFLINIDNATKEQVPSKLIDYALTKRPILSFNQNFIPKDKFMEFCKDDYNSATKICLDDYNIKNVCKKFERLFEE